ncbi:MAG TPA: toll/interleukin-1 receptor domain-containing protein [Chthoniobacterales bacterium]
MSGIFLSYRRDDSQGEALHLFDDLAEHFGQDQVFMDVTGIDPGRDFRKAIDGAVGRCDVLIVMIGNEWLDSKDDRGKRRLDDPTDFVRMETAAALRREIPVIPVLVQGAVMARSDQLPGELEALAWRNAFEVRHARWEVDVAELLKALKKVIKTSGTSGKPAAAESKRSELPTRKWVSALVLALGGALLGTAVYVLWPMVGEREKHLSADSITSVTKQPVTVEGSAEWLTAAQYQQAFDKKAEEGFYPYKVEGRCENESEQFRVEWKGIPLDAEFVSHHAITREFFETKNREYTSMGFSLESLNKFKDCAGRDRYQATWFKRN